MKNLLVRNATIFAVALILQTFAMTAFSEDPPPTITYPPNYYSENLFGYAAMISAQAEYERALGEARLAVARAVLVEAQAAHELQEVRRLTLLVNRMWL